MAKSKEVYRLTFTSDEIMGLLEAVTDPTIFAAFGADARSLVTKFRMQSFKINMGAATPAYVTTGTKRQAISLESLGAESQLYEVDNPIRNLASATVTANLKSTNNSGELSEAELDEVAAMERAMLADLAAMGNPNVIMEERRKVPRIAESGTDSFDISQL